MPCVALPFAGELVAFLLLAIEGVVCAAVVELVAAGHVLRVLSTVHAEVEWDAALALPEGVQFQWSIVAGQARPH